MADNIVVSYKSDLDAFIAQLKEVRQQNAGLGKEVENVGRKSKEASEEAGKSFSKVGNVVNDLAGKLVAAFAVERIIAFGNHAINEFAKAEKAAIQLLGALNGNEGAQKRLLKLAEEFKKKFAVDNDVIVSQQTFLAVQGRTEVQIKKVIEAAIQLSAVTGEDLPSSVQKLDATYEGNIGRLGKLDSRIGDLTKTQLQNGAAIDIISEKYKGFAEKGLEGASGQFQKLQIELDDTTKKIGEQLVPIKLLGTKIASAWLDGVTQIINTGKNLFDPSTTVFNPVNWFKPGFWTGQQETKPHSEDLFDTQLKLLEKFGDDSLRSLKEKNQKRLDEDKNLSRMDIQIFKTQNDAIDKILADRHPVIHKTKEEIDAEAKAAADRLKAMQEEANKQMQSREALAKFSFETEAKQFDVEASERAKNARETITDEKELQATLLQIDIDTTNKKLALAKELQKFGATDFGAQQEIDLQIQLNNLLGKRADLLKGKPNFPSHKDLDDATKDFIGYLDEIDDGSLESKKKHIQNIKEILQQENLSAENRAALEKKLSELTKGLDQSRAERLNLILSNISQISNDIQGLIDANFQSDIDNINARKEASGAAIDEELAKLEDKHKKNRIGDAAYDKEREKLLKKKQDQEKKADEETKALKRKQAEIDKELSIFRIILSTAQAIISALATGGLAGPALAAIAATTGAIELGIAIATPIPKFARGTKGKAQSGIGMVGEQGAEFIYMPSGTQVVPSAQSRKYQEAINAMIDGQFEKYYMPTGKINAMMTEYRKQVNEQMSKAFAQQLGATVTTSTDEYGFARALQNGTNIRNIDELARAIAKHLPESNPRRRI